MLPFTIVVDEAKHTLRAKLLGFWDVATAQAYVTALSAARIRVAPAGAMSWWLIDLTQSTLQPRDVAALISDQLGKVIPPEAKTAIVTPGALHTMQTKRLVVDETHRHFTTIGAAEAWLTEQGRPT